MRQEREAVSLERSFVERLHGKLDQLYGQQAGRCLARIIRLAEQHGSLLPATAKRTWDERDIVLIAYGDQVSNVDKHSLETLHEFLVAHQLDKLVRTVHLLPFYPSSSNDGFSVIDYREVDPAIGSWEDVHRLGQRFDLMVDLVLNHTSRSSCWFREYEAGREPYTRYFIEAEAGTDVSEVTRPRSLPLLTPVETRCGIRHLWTTFSPDQIDLNFANPDVLVEMVDILLFYIQQGARIIRLDAVAYTWKQIGTSCIHLPQTHTIVRLIRDLVDVLAPHVLVLTETNVPHVENVSYLGSGDEAHMIYLFSLPPLLLDAMLSRDARILMEWLATLQPAAPGTAYFNFTASHDGIGVRPLEGLMSGERLERLIEAVKLRGGLISTRRRPDGIDAPYEMNVSYVSALGEPCGMAPHLHARRFLTSQGLMLSLRGMPAIYFHSLVGTLNDHGGVRQSGQPRRINRRKFPLAELTAQLNQTESLQGRIFAGYCHMLSVRIGHPAFHPDAAQEVRLSEQPWLIALLRTSVDGRQRILVLANVSAEPQQLDLSVHTEFPMTRDLLTGKTFGANNRISLETYQLVWLEAKA